jgi:uncharacterized protein YdeI (YjbR/CyaY-like superfamily)
VGIKPPEDAIYFRSADELRAWFDANHETATELWIGYHRKATGRPSVSWSETVDEALCVGWIDSVRRSVPGDGWVIRLTPRRKRSIWSAVNVAKIAELRAAGRVRPAGEAAFAARRDDRTAIYSFEQAGEPTLAPDDEAQFRANPEAWAWFSAKAPSYRKQMIHWVISAKKPETRERRLATLIAGSAAGRLSGQAAWSREAEKGR